MDCLFNKKNLLTALYYDERKYIAYSVKNELFRINLHDEDEAGLSNKKYDILLSQKEQGPKYKEKLDSLVKDREKLEDDLRRVESNIARLEGQLNRPSSPVNEASDDRKLEERAKDQDLLQSIRNLSETRNKVFEAIKTINAGMLENKQLLDGYSNNLEPFVVASPLKYTSLLYFSKFCSGNIVSGDKKIGEVKLIPDDPEKEVEDPYRREEIDRIRRIVNSDREELFYEVSKFRMYGTYTYTTKDEKKLHVRQIFRTSLFEKFTSGSTVSRSADFENQYRRNNN